MRARAAVIAVLLLVSATAVRAQQLVTASAVVPIASPTGAGTRNLSFGAIMPGAAAVNVTVPAAAAAQSATVHSGGFRFNVGSTRGLSFNMTTPTQLVNGTASMPVSFSGAQFGAWCVTSNGSACTTTAFDPATAASVNVCAQTLGNGSCHPNRVFAASDQLSVYIGGLLTVPAGARAGTYTATVTLNITQVY